MKVDIVEFREYCHRFDKDKIQDRCIGKNCDECIFKWVNHKAQNEKTKIWIVQGYCGYETWIVAIFDTREKAEKFVKFSKDRNFLMYSEREVQH